MYKVCCEEERCSWEQMMMNVRTGGDACFGGKEIREVEGRRKDLASRQVKKKKRPASTQDPVVGQVKEGSGYCDGHQVVEDVPPFA